MTTHRGDLYVAGAFSFIDGVPLTNIAKWDGTNWSNLAEGLNEGVYAMAGRADGLYVGGRFSRAGQIRVGGIARWHDGQWWPVGNGIGIRYVPNTVVYGLALDATNVYVSGDFRVVDDVEVPFAAKWDGAQWSPVGRLGGISPNGMWQVAYAGSTLYGSGEIYWPDIYGRLYERLYLGQLQADQWTKVPNWLEGIPGRIWGVASNLYVSGAFSIAGLETQGFAYWDGIRWSAIPELVGSGYGVTALSAAGSNLLLGEAKRLDPFVVLSSRISLWDGSRHVVLAETGGQVAALAQYGDSIYCSGGFQFNGGVRTGNLGRWDGTRWSGLKPGNFQGVYGSVSAMLSTDAGVFVAGNFEKAGDAVVSHIARWDGSNWVQLAGGLNGTVTAMAGNGNELFVIGGFTLAGSAAATNIARWDGTNWFALGSGIEGSLTAIAAGAGNVYVGRFLVAPGRFPYYADVVRWDGSHWAIEVDRFGLPNRYGYIHALAVKGKDLYVGGEFTQAGDFAVTNIAKWDGEQWSGLAGGITGRDYSIPNQFLLTYVSVMAFHGNDLYVGGSFDRAGGRPAANIAKWDGKQWSSLGKGLGNQGEWYFGYVYDPVRTLFIKGQQLYVGGEFLRAFRAPTDFLAKWDGKEWSALGEGVNATVNGISARGESVFVGGTFSFAGGKPSYGFGIWQEHD